MNSILIMQTASRSIAPNAAMAWDKTARMQFDVHGVDVVVPAYATALPAAARTRGAAAPLPRGIPV